MVVWAKPRNWLANNVDHSWLVDVKPKLVRWAKLVMRPVQTFKLVQNVWIAAFPKLFQIKVQLCLYKFKNPKSTAHRLYLIFELNWMNGNMCQNWRALILLLTLWSWCRSDVGERRKVFLYFLWCIRSAKCHRQSPYWRSPFFCSRKGFSGRALWSESSS